MGVCVYIYIYMYVHIHGCTHHCHTDTAMQSSGLPQLGAQASRVQAWREASDFELSEAAPNLDALWAPFNGAFEGLI